MLIHDAAAVFVDLVDRAVLAVQLAVGAAAFTAIVVAVCVGPLVANSVKGARRGLSGRVSREQPSGDPSAATTPERRTARHTPAWAHTDHHRYEEAA